MTVDGSLSVTGMMLGGLISLIFVGYMLLSFTEGRKKKGLTLPQKFAGIFSLFFGFAMLSTWVYLIASGWVSNCSVTPSIRAWTELGSSVIMIIAGIAMLREWSRGPALFVLANGTLLMTSILSLADSAPGHQSVMVNGMAIVLTIVFNYIVGLVYMWEHFVLHIDEKKRHPV